VLRYQLAGWYPKKVAQAQRICGSPRDTSFAVDAFEVPEQQTAEIHAGGHARPAHLLRVELRTGPFRELVEPLLGQDLVDRLIVRVALRTKLLVRDEQVLLLAIAGAHCHTVFVHHLRSAVDLDQVFRSAGTQQTRLGASAACRD
jgi:hypothetical protein